MIEVFDNLLSEEDYDILRAQITADDFCWNWSPSTIMTDAPMEGDTPQFVKSLFLDFTGEPSLRDKQIDADKDPYNAFSRKFPETFKIAWTAIERSEREFAGIDKFLRIKANLLLQVPNRPRFHPPHQDTDAEGYLSVVYYLNDSDGDTFFFGENNTSISPKANRGVLFDSNIRHCSSNPITTERRMIINSVFRPKYS